GRERGGGRLRGATAPAPGAPKKIRAGATPRDGCRRGKGWGGNAGQPRTPRVPPPPDAPGSPARPTSVLQSRCPPGGVSCPASSPVLQPAFVLRSSREPVTCRREQP